MRTVKILQWPLCKTVSCNLTQNISQTHFQGKQQIVLKIIIITVNGKSMVVIWMQPINIVNYLRNQLIVSLWNANCQQFVRYKAI